MTIVRRFTLVVATASTTQTLPASAVKINSVTQVTGSATWAAPTKYAIVTGTPAAGQVQFTGTPQSASNTLTFSSALTAGDILLVDYVPVGSIQAAA